MTSRTGDPIRDALRSGDYSNMPPWREPVLPANATAAEAYALRMEAVSMWHAQRGVLRPTDRDGYYASPVGPVPLREALAIARLVPEPVAPVARGDDGDRLVANLRARRNAAA